MQCSEIQAYDATLPIVTQYYCQGRAAKDTASNYILLHTHAARVLDHKTYVSPVESLLPTMSCITAHH